MYLFVKWPPETVLAAISISSQLGYLLTQPSADCFATHAVLSQVGHGWQLTLANTSNKAPEPEKPVDSFRPY